MIWIPQSHYEVSLGLGFREAQLMAKPMGDIGRMWAWILSLSSSSFAAHPDFMVRVTFGGSWTCISISRAVQALWESLLGRCAWGYISEHLVRQSSREGVRGDLACWFFFLILTVFPFQQDYLCGGRGHQGQLGVSFQKGQGSGKQLLLQ